MARAKTQIDWEFVKERLSLFVENMDIAAELGIHYSTLEQRCLDKPDKKNPSNGGMGMPLSQLRQQCRAKTKKQLLATQIKMALGTTVVTEKSEKGVPIKFKHILPDVSMLVHLGKNFLDQTDKVRNENVFAGFIFEDEPGGDLPPMLEAEEKESDGPSGLPPMLNDGSE